MPRFTYLLVDLDDGSIKGTDNAEDLEDYTHNEDYLIIVTSGDQAVIQGDPTNPQDIQSLCPEDDEVEDDDD